MKTIIIFAALFCWFGNAAAQQEATLNLHDGREITGIISHITSDSVYLTEPKNVSYSDRNETLPVLVFARPHIASVEIRGGSNVLGSTLVGMGIGGLTGALLVLTNQGDGTMKELENFLDAVFVGSAVLVGGIIGLTVGLLAGRPDTTFDLSRDADFDLLRKAYGNAPLARR
ncbi:MAG: hypothetical protein M5R41_06215 [Bacteroidia bacterium]|nr:hypothetical protein [Bacteroidia bacterium]